METKSPKDHLDHYKEGYQDGIQSVLKLVNDYCGKDLKSQAELVRFIRGLELEAIYPRRNHG
jgi:hypothetical protein